MNHCDTCHWYSLRDGDWGMCTWHTGARNPDLIQIRTGARKPLYVRSDFGCARWEEDKREHAEAAVTKDERSEG